MTNGQKYSITFHRFLRCFGIMAGDKDLRKLHDEGELDKDELHIMCPRGEHANYGKVKNLYTYFAALLLLEMETPLRSQSFRKI
jgi:hypothetical protein